MPSNRFARPKILWGAAFVNTINVGYPLDNVTAGDEPRAGSVFDQSVSGLEDSWITGRDYLLTGDLRHIPQTDTTSPVATGWDGATGVREFLAYARQKNVIRFYPDASAGAFIDCYLSDPMKGAGSTETNGLRKLTITLRNTTTAFDGY